MFSCNTFVIFLTSIMKTREKSSTESAHVVSCDQPFDLDVKVQKLLQRRLAQIYGRHAFSQALECNEGLI